MTKITRSPSLVDLIFTGRLSAGCSSRWLELDYFKIYAPEKIDYAINRYVNESRRLLSVLESRLKENGDWLVGDKYSIADIINYAWVSFISLIDVDIKEFPVLERWCERVAAREAVKCGMAIPPRPAPKQSAETK